MQVRDAMAESVRIASPRQTIREAAHVMADIDAGFIPVRDQDRLVGMITDRDIAIRTVALGKSPETPVSEIMSREVMYCFADNDIEDVAQNMADLKIRRMPVLNASKRLAGVVSLADIAGTQPARQSAASRSRAGCIAADRWGPSQRAADVWMQP